MPITGTGGQTDRESVGRNPQNIVPVVTEQHDDIDMLLRNEPFSTSLPVLYPQPGTPYANSISGFLSHARHGELRLPRVLVAKEARVSGALHVLANQVADE